MVPVKDARIASVTVPKAEQFTGCELRQSGRVPGQRKGSAGGFYLLTYTENKGSEKDDYRERVGGSVEFGRKE